MRIFLALLLAAILAAPAQAGVTAAQLSGVEAKSPAHARFDPALVIADVTGRRATLTAFLHGRPAFLVFADYTCHTLCGTELFSLGAALEQARLPPDSFQIVVMGIDPKDTAAAALAMAKAEIPMALQGATTLLLPDAKTVEQATGGLGFHYIYDPGIDQFAHPAVVYLLAPNGTVRGVLSPFDLAAVDLKDALAGEPPPGLVGTIRSLCNGLALLTGMYDGPVLLATKAAAAIVVLSLAGFIALLICRRGRSS
ncbi:MAG TPA: SCO family protein [Dongiaceae bacterium]|jgi:protein SCO1/2